jgi:hypothetical protein
MATDDHQRTDRPFRLGIAPDRLERTVHQETDADARADAPKPDRQTRTEELSSCWIHV